MIMSTDDRLRKQRPFHRQATSMAWFKGRHPLILRCWASLTMMEAETCGDGGERYCLATGLRRSGIADFSEMAGPHLA